MPYTVRLATAADIPSISALIPISVRALSAGIYTDRQIESALVHVFGVDSQLLADGTYFVAVDGETLVGCGGWSKRATLYGGDQAKDVADPLLDPATDSARIRAFFVHPSWARQGIGRRIIEQSEAAARAAGFQSMVLGATLPGEPLYAALGYVAITRSAAEMPDGESLPVIHMEKLLD